MRGGSMEQCKGASGKRSGGSRFGSEKMSVFAAVVLVALFWGKNAYANLMWPAFFEEAKIFAWFPILLCLVIEYPFVRKVTGFDVKKSVLVDIVMNSVSTFAGLFLVPVFSDAPIKILQGLVAYSAVKSSLPSPAMWAATLLLKTLVNALIEVWAIQVVFNVEKKWSNLGWLFLGNWLGAIWLSLLTFLSFYPYGLPGGH